MPGILPDGDTDQSRSLSFSQPQNQNRLGGELLAIAIHTEFITPQCKISHISKLDKV